jgi:ring-1,2-phenylacetyl-CoA epoxidase subunit PaaC
MTEDEYGAYHALVETSDDQRWAFGTGFTDALAGVDTTVPEGIDAQALATYCLMLGDDALVLSHRLQEWTTRLPELEEEAAVANIALDLLGQARLLLTRAGRADGTDRDDDYYAFTREQDGFRNVRLVEPADGDFAELIVRLLIFSSWRLELLDELRGSADPVLAAIAAKGVKEVTYHRDWAAQWAVRLGDGTELSNSRMQTGLETIWPLVDELFEVHPIEARLVGVAADPSETRERVYAVLNEVFQAAMLIVPTAAPLATVRGRSGRDGVHTQDLGDLLTELQSVARAHPDATW